MPALSFAWKPWNTLQKSIFIPDLVNGNLGVVILWEYIFQFGRRCIHTWMHSYIPTYNTSIYMHTYKVAHTHTCEQCMSTWMHKAIHEYMHNQYMHTCLHTYIKYIRACLHTLRADKQTYTLTDIHTDMQSPSPLLLEGILKSTFSVLFLNFFWAQMLIVSWHWAP